ncbi:hypothetical protein EV714DRAFT_201309 [Schizophyllum commune]
MWKSMSVAERGPWVADAKKERDQHKRDYPDFQYYQGKKKRRSTVQRDDKPARTTQLMSPSRSRTTSTTPGPATPFATDHQTVDPVIAQMALINGPLERSFGAICGQPDQYGSQQQYSQPLNGTYATDEGVVECENQWVRGPSSLIYPSAHRTHVLQTKTAGPNLPSSNTKFGNVTQGHPYSTDFASVGAYDGAMSSQPFGPPAFLESNGVPIPNLSGNFAFSGSYNDSAVLPVASDDAALFGGTSGFVQSHNDVPYYGAHTAYGSATDLSALPSFQQTHPEAHSMQPQPHPTHLAQVDIFQTQPIFPLDATAASQDASIAPPTASFVSPELASIPLRHTRHLQSRLEGARGTVPRIRSPNGLSSRNLATEERPAPSRGYLRAPHEYTERDRLSDDAPSPNELDPPPHAHSVPQATASSHRRTASGTPFWPAPRDFRKHLRFCSDTPTTRPSVQRTGDWLTDWQASGLANAQSDLSASAQLDAFANVPLDPLAQDAPYANAQTALYANAQTAPCAAQESGSYMDALSTSYTNAPASSWMQVPTTSYEQPPTTSYTDAQTRSYVEPLTTTSSQTPAFPSAPATSHTQPSASYEQGSAQSYPDPAMQLYPDPATQPYPNAPLDSYSQASELPYPDGPIPPHVDLTTPYYNPVNHQYGSRADHC